MAKKKTAKKKTTKKISIPDPLPTSLDSPTQPEAPLMVVTGVCSWDLKTLRWIHTLRASGFAGHIILYITDESCDIALLQAISGAYKVEFRQQAQNPLIWSWGSQPCFLAFQWIFIEQIAKEFPDSWILRTDIHDVVFQTNPEEQIKTAKPNQVFLGTEGTLAKDNPFMVQWYGDDVAYANNLVHRNLLDDPTYNSGMICATGKTLQPIAKRIHENYFKTLADQTETYASVVFAQEFENVELVSNLEFMFALNSNLKDSARDYGKIYNKDRKLVCIVHANGDNVKKVIDFYWPEENYKFVANRIVNNINPFYPTITAYISTKGRSESTLPLAVKSLMQQTLKPDQITIIDDNEPRYNYNNNAIYKYLITEAANKQISMIFVDGKKRGQVANHETIRSTTKTDLIFRMDDDEIADNEVLENLVKSMQDKKTGAVGPLVLVPGIVSQPHEMVSSKIEHVKDYQNVQWFVPDSTELIPVDHLYSSFIYRRIASSNYPKLSPQGHREETIFTYTMALGGWRLFVDPTNIIWHYRLVGSGIHQNLNKANQENDEKVFADFLAKYGVEQEPIFLLHGKHGLGDLEVLTRIIPEIIKQHQDDKIIIGTGQGAYVELLEKFKDDITIISEDQALNSFGERFKKLSIYNYMGVNKWDKSLEEAYKKLYLKD